MNDENKGRLIITNVKIVYGERDLIKKAKKMVLIITLIGLSIILLTLLN